MGRGAPAGGDGENLAFGLPVGFSSRAARELEARARDEEAAYDEVQQSWGLKGCTGASRCAPYSGRDVDGKLFGVELPVIPPRAAYVRGAGRLVPCWVALRERGLDIEISPWEKGREEEEAREQERRRAEEEARRLEEAARRAEEEAKAAEREAWRREQQQKLLEEQQRLSAEHGAALQRQIQDALAGQLPGTVVARAAPTLAAAQPPGAAQPPTDLEAVKAMLASATAGITATGTTLPNTGTGVQHTWQQQDMQLPPPPPQQQQQQQRPAPLPPGWDHWTDPASGHTVFRNLATNTTTWDDPRNAAPPPAAAPAAGHAYPNAARAAYPGGPPI